MTRKDVTLSCRRKQREALKCMAAVEGLTVTELIDLLVKFRIASYPPHRRLTVEEAMAS